MKRTAAVLAILCLSSFAEVQLPADLQAPGIWKAFGPGATQTGDGRERTMRLASPRAGKEVMVRWRATLLKTKAAARIPVVVGFEAAVADVAKADAADPWGGCLVMLHGHLDGRYRQLAARRIDGPDPGFQPYLLKTTIPEGMEDLYLEFVLQRASGSLAFRAVTISSPAPAE